MNTQWKDLFDSVVSFLSTPWTFWAIVVIVLVALLMILLSRAWSTRGTLTRTGGFTPEAEDLSNRQYGYSAVIVFLLLVCIGLLIFLVRQPTLTAGGTPIAPPDPTVRDWLETAQKINRNRTFLVHYGPQGAAFTLPQLAPDTNEYREILSAANTEVKRGGSMREILVIRSLRFVTNRSRSRFETVVVTYDGKNTAGQSVKGATVPVLLRNWDEAKSDCLASQLSRQYQHLLLPGAASSPVTCDLPAYDLPIPVVDTVTEPVTSTTPAGSALTGTATAPGGAAAHVSVTVIPPAGTPTTPAPGATPRAPTATAPGATPGAPTPTR